MVWYSKEHIMKELKELGKITIIIALYKITEAGWRLIFG